MIVKKLSDVKGGGFPGAKYNEDIKKSFGIDVYFQKDKNGQVRGYGIVDHVGKIAFDGSKVMKLSELIDFVP